MLQKIRDAIAGKKTYFTAVIGILTALVAWSVGELTDVQVIGAIWIALQVIFIRAGTRRDTLALDMEVVEDIYDDGYTEGFEDGCEAKK